MSDSKRIHEDNVGGIIKVTYDVANDTSEVGDIYLPFPAPTGTIIHGGFIDVLTPFTSQGAATVALGIEASGDLLAATAIAGLTGRLDLIPDMSAANIVKTTDDRKLMITIAAEALDAGKLNVFMYYLNGS